MRRGDSFPKDRENSAVSSSGREVLTPSGSVTRRGLITSASVLAAGFAEPQMAQAVEHIRRRADVIVVGGGLSGLSAASALVAHNRSVIVLEARDRVGGRTWTKNVPGGRAWIDMGGQFVGPGMDRILALAKTVGVTTFPSYHQGNDVFVFQGKRSESPAGTFALPEADMEELGAAFEKIDAFAKQVPADEPGRAPLAAEWDSQTVETWMRDNIKSALAQFVMRAGILGYFAVDPQDMSFLHLLFYVSAGGGVEALHKSGLAERFDGGAQVVSDRVAQQLGGRVMLKRPVREIDQSGNMIVVKTDQDRFEALRVIVALPPTLAGRIFYRPGLPANRDGLTQRAFMATTIKCHAVYPTPFWREKGLSGQVISDETVVDITHDNSPPSGQPGIMAGFLFGNHGREWADQPEADIRRTVLAAFGKHFGPEAASPTEFYIANWPSEIWSRGCYSGIMPTGVWTGYPNALRTPAGRIHWAGTETATGWCQYMDGAVRSGERAAEEVLRKL